MGYGRRNGVITQGLIGDHMVRVHEIIRGNVLYVYRVVIGLYHKQGNTTLNPRYRLMNCRPDFLTATKAWEYGVNIARGATSNARNN